MIEAFFICSGQGEVLLERNYGVGPIPRSVCEDYFSVVVNSEEKETVKPVIFSEEHQTFLFHYSRHNLVFMCVTKKENPALLFTRFLQHVDVVLCDFFGMDKLDEKLKSNFIYLYMLFDELIDGGFPNITEPNLIKEMMDTPGMFGHTAGTIISNPTLPESIVSPIFWRKSKVVYVQNEIFVDMVEKFNAIFNCDGQLVTSYVYGEIVCTVHLSGLPDLTLLFQNPLVMDDVSLHPCIRYFRWIQQKIISFVPPDGEFVLLKYRAGSSSTPIPPPISARPDFILRQGGGNISLGIAARNTGGKQVESVSVEFRLPTVTATVSPTVTAGFTAYDNNKKTLLWDIGKLPLSGEVTLDANFAFEEKDSFCEERPVALISFQIHQFAISMLKVSGLNAGPEIGYRMFKGVKGITLNGNYEVRL